MSFLSNDRRFKPPGSRISAHSSARILIILSVLTLLAVGLGFWLPSGPESRPIQKQAEAVKVSPETSNPTPTAEAHPAVVPLYPAPTAVEGQRLPKESALRLIANAPSIGRVAPIDRTAFTKLTALHENDTVELPLLDGTVARGTVNIVRHDEGGWWRVGGALESPRSGSFAIGTDGQTAGGLIQFQRENLAYEITSDDSGALVLRERRRSDVVCSPLPRPNFEPETPVAAALFLEWPPVIPYAA